MTAFVLAGCADGDHPLAAPNLTLTGPNDYAGQSCDYLFEQEEQVIAELVSGVIQHQIRTSAAVAAIFLGLLYSPLSVLITTPTAFALEFWDGQLDELRARRGRIIYAKVHKGC